ncbi:hypothetical protein [Streptomyces subrutilus]|uniref:Uncharacterized protein n=1 Tax=Streptomyces subrutilus TaxID=36818 RepID=A0A1E5NXY9_9ACTN|nr:hypothetical protein [Streptomyces subrutilus]OEJ21121.1 hypothetical protein BGK67_35100 [Streptomyces subrutilus]
MPWDSVPWFVEGAAEHSSEVTRLLAYSAFGGAEGIVGPSDLRVQALSSPAAAVRVGVGACAITNRAPGGAYQAYAARLPTADQVAVAATGVTARSDLVVARIENPHSQGESWPLPNDPKAGPYVFTRIISGVPKTTTSIEQVRPGDSAITLARIDLPPNTSSVTGAMITDLREMVQPRRERRIYPLFTANAEFLFPEDGSWHDWPNVARVNIRIPKWATRAQLVTTIGGLGLFNALVRAEVQHFLGSSIWGGSPTTIDDDQGGGARRLTQVVASTINIPPAMRGTMQPLFLKTWMSTDHTGDLRVDNRSAIVHDVEFQEAPELDPGL